MRALRKSLAAGAVSGALMMVVMWLFYSQQSPLHEYAIWHTGIANALTNLNLPALFLGIVASGNVHQPSEIAVYIGIFVQWAIVGALVAWPILLWQASRQGRAEGDA